MPLPDIFTEGSPQEERLASYFEELYEYLMEEGVPEDRLPQPWHVLSRIVKCIDHERLQEWLDAYISVEGEEPINFDEMNEEDSSREGPEPKRRPSYLRAIHTNPSETDLTDDTPVKSETESEKEIP